MALATLAFPLSLLFFLSITNAEQMKVRDPYIVCPGNTVPDNANGLPAGYSQADYFNVMQLCSALNGNRKNVGCVCTNSQESSFHCYPGVADSRLFHAVITDTLKPFPTFCADSCFCTDTDTAAMNRSTADEVRHSRSANRMNPVRGNDNYFDPNDADYQIHQLEGEREGGYRSIPDGPGDGWDGEETLNKEPVAHGQCWKNCTSNADCSTGGEKGCMCSTQSEQYQPGRGTVAFVAACIISMSGVGGKREEMGPCPCNATYVSYSCCGVANGLVWEEKRFKLGELLMEHEL